MSKLNRDELIEAVVNKEMLTKDLYIKLNGLVADRLNGVSIPYYTDAKTLYIFTSINNAREAEDYLDAELEKLLEKRDEVKHAVEVGKISYIGKINKVNNNIDMQKEPIEFVTTLDTILTNAKFIGIEKVFIDFKSSEEIEITLDELLSKLEVNAEQPKLLMSEAERQEILNNKLQVKLRFNPVKIFDYVNPFGISNQKSLDLSQLLFDDEANKLESLLADLQYHELAFLSHQIIREYIPMAKDMENKGMEDNFNSYLEVVRKFLGKKLVSDLKDGKAFYLILVPTEDRQRLTVQADKNKVIPLLYTDFFSTNNSNPFCLVNSYETFKQFIENEKPSGLQLSAGPTATVLLQSEYILNNM